MEVKAKFSLCLTNEAQKEWRLLGYKNPIRHSTPLRYFSFKLLLIYSHKG
jgi:hypothetical protein